jgi:hypothetical protein
VLAAGGHAKGVNRRAEKSWNRIGLTTVRAMRV